MALRSGYKGFKKLLGLKMIRPGTLAVDDAALANTFFPRSEQAVLGAKNFLPNTASSTTTNTVDFTVNADKSVTINGTNSSTSQFGFSVGRVVLEAGSYIVSGLVDDGGYSSFWINTYNVTDSTNVIDVTTANQQRKFTLTSTKTIEVKIFVAGSAVINNKTVYPMVRLASDTDPNYATFAMTNRELTDEVLALNGSASDQKTAINAIITAATEATDFAAFKTAMGAITPVTRSLSREAVPEAEPAEVIEEKTVTKKSTKKTTVKEGDE